MFPFSFSQQTFSNFSPINSNSWNSIPIQFYSSQTQLNQQENQIYNQNYNQQDNFEEIKMEEDENYNNFNNYENNEIFDFEDDYDEFNDDYDDESDEFDDYQNEKNGIVNDILNTVHQLRYQSNQNNELLKNMIFNIQ